MTTAAGASSYSNWGDAGEPSHIPLAGPAPSGPAPTPLGARASSKGTSMADVTSSVFTPKQVKELYKYFKQLDLNGDGHISASELYLVFKAMKLQHSPDSVNTLIRTVDNSGNNEIEFDEFVRVRAYVRVRMPSTALTLLPRGVRIRGAS
jgi:hypothetical protein